MVGQVENILSRVRWDKTLIQEFLGQMLTEPKPHVVFDPPHTPISLSKFRANLCAKELQLDSRTQLLFSGKHFYLNGESESVPPVARTVIRQLADRRSLPAATKIADEVTTILHRWYTYGFVNFAKRS